MKGAFDLMKKLKPARELSGGHLALEIGVLHEQIIDAANTSLQRAIRIGELLVEQRSRLNHGEWLPWIEAHVPFTGRTARNYIRLWESRERLKLETVSDLTEAYRLLSPSASPPAPPNADRFTHREAVEIADVTVFICCRDRESIPSSEYFELIGRLVAGLVTELI